jgi:hypothetical protein
VFFHARQRVLRDFFFQNHLQVNNELSLNWKTRDIITSAYDYISKLS